MNSSAFCRGILLFSGFLMIALAASWPLVTVICSAISCGTESEATVPLLNVWTLWWNADRAIHGFQDYWNAPIFYPTSGTFAFSEAQPTMLIAAPVVWLTGNRALAYNFYQLLIITLNGFSSYHLFKRVGHQPWLAFCGGVMCELLPFVWWQFGVIQLTTIFGIIWTIHSLMDVFDVQMIETSGDDSSSATKTLWHPLCSASVRLGVSFGLTYWLCNYWGLFLAILLVPSSLCLWSQRMLHRAFWKDLFIAFAIASLMILPIVYMQKSLSGRHSWQREKSLIVSLSAHPRDLTDTPWASWNPMSNWTEFPEKERSNVWPLGGGGLKLLLSVFGFVVAGMQKGRRRWAFFCAEIGLVAFGLSLGPALRFPEFHVFDFGGQSPYEWMQQHLPGFGLIRSPFRFALFVQLAAVFLSLEALAPLGWVIVSGNSKLKSLSVAASALVGLLISVEVIPPQLRVYPCPKPTDLPVWVTWLRDELPQRKPIACLPFPNGYSAKDYETTAVWMYWATFHRHPMINGYSGFFPETFVSLKDDLHQYVTDPSRTGQFDSTVQLSRYPAKHSGLAKLNESGAVCLVVQRSFATREDVWAHPATRWRWGLVASDEDSQIDIYEIQPATTE